MSLGTTLFPPANREAALVAGLRTMWQTIRTTGILGAAGGIAISATGLATVDWTGVAYAAGAVLLTGIINGGLAAGDILAHGLPAAYTNAAVASIPAAVVEPAPVVDGVQTV